MPVEQSGDEDASPQADDAASRGSMAPHGSTAPRSSAAEPELDEVKRKFREALERKREQHAHANAEGAHATGKVQQAHGPASSRRSFRRKSGS